MDPGQLPLDFCSMIFRDVFDFSGFWVLDGGAVAWECGLQSRIAVLNTVVKL